MRVVAGLVAGAVLVVACGGGANGGSGPAAPATVTVIDTAVERQLEESFLAVDDGQELAVGDVVRTDELGFGRIDYQDGSLARLGPSTQVTVLALAFSEDGRSVGVELGEGRLWNRVEPGGAADTYEVETVVGTAAVRGTTFDVGCQPDRCTFTVFDGVIEVTLLDGEVIELRAPRTLEVVADRDPAEPRELLVGQADADPWWARNRAEDVRGDLEGGGGQVVTVVVPGTSNLWLAGMPDGSTLPGDVAPDQSPVMVEGIEVAGGAVLRFAATGSVSYAGGAPRTPPDGEPRGNHGAANGIGPISVGWNALVGVFLGDGRPDEAVDAPEALDFTAPEVRDEATIAPALRQPFFIGDGVRSDGTPNDVIVPDGATRLFLGTVDGYGWYNNTGSFTVTVAVVDDP